MQGQRRFDESGSARSSFGVANLRLDRTESAPRSFGFRFAENVAECGYFHGIADLGAGSMSLHQLHRSGRNPHLFVCSLQSLLLPCRNGSVNCRTLAIAGRANGTDHGINAIPISLGIAEAFQHHDSQPFAENRTIAVFVKRPGIPTWRERGSLAEAHVHEDVVEGIHSPGHRDIHSSGCQLHSREMHRTQRRRTGGIHDAIRAAEIEAVGNSPGHHVPEQTGEGIFLPLHITVGDSLHDLFRGLRIDSRFEKGFPPFRMTESRSQRNDEFLRSRHSENDADSTSIKTLIRSVTGIVKSLLSSDQP